MESGQQIVAASEVSKAGDARVKAGNNRDGLCRRPSQEKDDPGKGWVKPTKLEVA